MEDKDDVKSNDPSRGEAAMMLNDHGGGGVTVESQSPPARRQKRCIILLAFVVLFAVLFLVMTTLYVTERHKQAQNDPKARSTYSSPSSKVCATADCFDTATVFAIITTMFTSIIIIIIIIVFAIIIIIIVFAIVTTMITSIIIIIIIIVFAIIIIVFAIVTTMITSIIIIIIIIVFAIIIIIIVFAIVTTMITSIIIIIIIIVFAIIIIIIVFAIVTTMITTYHHYHHHRMRFFLPPPITIYSFFLDLMNSIDPRKDPCENFYDYACNGWIKKHPVPKDTLSVDQWSLLTNKVEQFIKAIVKDFDLRKKYENITAVAKAFGFFDSCMNIKDTFPPDKHPVAALIKKYLPWPITDPNWNQTSVDINRMLGRVTRDFDLGPFFRVMVQTDLKNSSRSMINVQQTFQWGLFPTQLVRNLSSALRSQSVYKDLIYNVSMLVGATDEVQLRKDAEEIFAIEKTLATIGKGFGGFDEELYYGKYKLSKLQEESKDSTINWLVLFNEFLSDVKYRVTEDEEIIVTDISTVVEMMKRTVGSMSKRAILNYVGWRLVQEIYQYGSQSLDDLRVNFRIKGWNLLAFNKEENCHEMMKNNFGMPLSRVFVDKYFPRTSKELMKLTLAVNLDNRIIIIIFIIVAIIIVIVINIIIVIVIIVIIINVIRILIITILIIIIIPINVIRILIITILIIIIIPINVIRILIITILIIIIITINVIRILIITILIIIIIPINVIRILIITIVIIIIITINVIRILIITIHIIIIIPINVIRILIITILIIIIITINVIRILIITIVIIIIITINVIRILIITIVIIIIITINVIRILIITILIIIIITDNPSLLFFIAKDLAESIIKVFQETLKDSEWMDDKSKAAAIEKAEAVRGNYGYPDFVRNNEQLDARSQRISIYKDSFLDTMVTILANQKREELINMVKPVDRSEWTETPLLVNPYYLPMNNIMIFPAAFLQPPFYDAKYPRAVSYGGVGAIIAHELIHGFDNSGKDFDKDGNNVKWWTDLTLAHYKNRTKCLVKQYGDFNYHGFPVDGQTTLAENIGDNVGLRETFKAYHQWVEENGEEPSLPGIFNNEQVFFLSYARNWCKSMSPIGYETQVFMAEHSPSIFRVNGPLQNFPEFSRVFNCPPWHFSLPYFLFSSHIDPSQWSNPLTQTMLSDLMNSIDPRKDPCQNFYAYACDGWIKRHPKVPENRGQLDEWVLLDMKVAEFIKDFFKNKEMQKQYSNVTAVMKSVAFHESCMNLQDSDPSKGQALIHLIHKYMSWPVIDPNWNESKFNLEHILGRISRDLNVNPFVNIVVQSDLKNGSRNMINVSEAGRVERDGHLWYVSEAGRVERDGHLWYGRKVYREFIHEMLLLLGANDTIQTKKDADEILNVEWTIAKVLKGYYAFSEENYYGKYKVSELMEETGTSPINWLVYFNELFRKTRYKVASDKEIIVTDMEVIKKTMNMLKGISKRALLNYLGWRIILHKDNYQHISQEFYKRRERFRKDAIGIITFNLEDHCRTEIKKHFAMAVARVFVDKKFPGKSKQLAEDIGQAIKEVFQETLENSNWMDKKSKAAAIEKAKAVWGNYGYPDYILDNDKLNDKYQGITVYKDSIFKTMLLIITAKRMEELAGIKTDVDRTRWSADPLLVNPSYIPVQNMMSFPSPFLQPPLYDQKYLRAISYGGVGTIIAHELIHGFDNSGKNYDKYGNYVNWWTDSTLDLYNNKTKCFVEQYNNFVFEGWPLDGDISLAENIADNIGVQEAFKAYRRYVKINGEEPRLPGTLFTNEQVFFLSYARNWCRTLKPEFVEFEVMDEYSPSPFRIGYKLYFTSQRAATKSSRVFKSFQLSCGHIHESGKQMFHLVTIVTLVSSAFNRWSPFVKWGRLVNDVYHSKNDSSFNGSFVIGFREGLYVVVKVEYSRGIIVNVSLVDPLVSFFRSGGSDEFVTDTVFIKLSKYADCIITYVETKVCQCATKTYKMQIKCFEPDVIGGEVCPHECLTGQQLQLGKQNAEAEGITDYIVTSKNIHLQCLLDLLDHIMLHGLDNVENGYWLFVLKLTHSATVKIISKHPQVTNALDKGRVWVFVAVCEGLLESYIRLFLEGQKDAKKFYTKESFLRDQERLLVLQTLVSGLDFVDFALDLLIFNVSCLAGSPSPNDSPGVHSSSSSSSTLIVSPTDSNGTFELSVLENKTPSRHTQCNDVTNHQGNEHQNEAAAASNQNKEIKRGDNSRKITKPDNTDRSLSTETELLALLDPKYASVDEDGVRALNRELMYDFRCRGGSSVSDISMDEPGVLFHRELLRKKRVKKNKIHARRDTKEEEPERHYPAPGDKEHPGDDDVNPDDPQVTRVYTSIQPDYRDNDSESDCNSVVSGDSLDQFCRDADFGSSLNLSTEVSVQPTVKECHNEQPTVAEEKPDDQKTGDEKPSAKADDAPSNIVENIASEYEGSFEIRMRIILGLPKRPSLQDISGTSCDVRIDTNTLLLLSLEIFKHSEEQFHRMLRTSTGHQFGQLQCAHVMITDFAVYLLRKVKFREETSFHTDLVIEFSNVKSVEIGLNCQTVTVASRKEKFDITFGDEAVSRSFISSLTAQMSRASPSLSLSNLVSSSSLQQESALAKWMSKDKHLNMSSPNVSCFSLVHWCGLTGADSTIEVISYRSVMEGTLEFKSQNYLRLPRNSRWTMGYFVLTNGTLWQYLSQNDKTARNMIDLRESRCGGCRQLHDADRPFAFEIVSSDGSGSLLVISAQNEHEACEWIFKICQSIAESYDDESDRGCTVMKYVPSNLITTKDKIVICLSQPNNENEYKLITSCALQNITKIYVDNNCRKYCIIKYDYSEAVGSEGSWFVSFNTEFELSKFEHSIAEAWRELFQ
ncbi:hypothetical protein QZH41_008291, partial [Actinostola sp. cb2023]